MKKRYLLLLLAFSGGLHAQTYHPLVETGKLWSTYHFNLPPSPPSSDYVKFDGDTVFGAITYKKVFITENANQTQWTYYGAIREDNQRKVFLQRAYTLNNERLLYDFNLIPGDSLLLMMNPNYYFLDSTGTVTIETGEQRKTYMLHCTIYPCTENWIEGIGSITFGVMNSGFCGAVGDDPNMLCAWENDSLKYHWPDYPECFVLTGINDLSQDSKSIKIYPNPAIDKITITGLIATREEINVSVFTINGEALMIQKVRNAEQLDIDVSRLAKGLYIVKIQENNSQKVEMLAIE